MRSGRGEMKRKKQCVSSDLDSCMLMRQNPRQPCSSCVLRKTERFCYTSEMEDDSMIKGSNAKRSERSSHISNPNSTDSTNSQDSLVQQGGESQNIRQTSKRVKTGAHHGTGRDWGTSSTSSDSVMDTQAIQKTIESMKSTIRSLQQIAGLKVEVEEKSKSAIPIIVTWDEVAHLLPSKEDCEMIIDCFFIDAFWQTVVINQLLFRKQWQKLATGQNVRRSFVAIVCGVISHALLLAPGYNPTSRLPIQSESRTFCALAHQLINPPDKRLFDSTDIGLEELQVQCLIVTYMSFSGWAEPAWVEVGKGIRNSKALNLHDEEKWPLQELSDWDIEFRRRIAWDFVGTDRWLSLHYLRIPDLPAALRTNRPSLYSDECYDVETGRLVTASPTLLRQYSFDVGKFILSTGAEKVSRFLNDFSSMTPLERYTAARDFETFFLELEEKLMPLELKFDLACDINQLNNPESCRRACHSLISFTSGQRLRCTVMRQFLLDQDAPIDLRVAALEHARKIIEVTPLLVTLSSSPWVSFSSSWCSGHLFCAASTFAIVYLGEKEQDLQDLNWFAGKIFEVIEALSFLGVKDRVAKRCEELLTALCTGKAWLRERFMASRTGRASTNLLQKRKKSFEDDEEDSQAKVDEDFLKDLSEARKGNLPGHTHMVDLDKGTTFSPLTDNKRNSINVIGEVGPSTGQSNGANRSQQNIFSLDAPSREQHQQLNGMQNSQLPPPSSELTTEPWGSWPLLNDQQWSSLLSTLEEDMNTLAANAAAV